MWPAADYIWPESGVCGGSAVPALGREGSPPHTYMIPVVLAALMPDVVQALVEGHARAVVDRLQLDAAVGGLGDVADDVEDREHRLLGVGLTRQRHRVAGKSHDGGEEHEQRIRHHGVRVDVGSASPKRMVTVMHSLQNQLRDAEPGADAPHGSRATR